jgi:glycosyltransferase involved in cell wall biosynthesis/2-polyprenyl-3-methyl-5-hydroxy-6-metoxy-1,4-benzoquinol methylase
MKSTPFDVSLVLALHREGTLLRRTLLSLREAARHARAEGITVELVATLDRTDELTRQVLRQFETDGFEGWTVAEVDHGSLGPSRSSGIKVARGRYIQTCDGDDLISFNWFTVMFRLAEVAGPANVIFPQYLYSFGDCYYRIKYFPLGMVTPLAFLEQHPFISRAFAHRSVFEAVPYTDARVSSGYAYEDWHFNAECVARGYQILVAENTILFYRQRPGSLLDQANNHTTRQIPPCTLFEPPTWVQVTREAYERLAPLGGARPRAPDSVGWGRVLDSAPHRAFIRAANEIDPAIDPLQIRMSDFDSNLNGPDFTAGLAYHEICRFIGAQRFDEVFLLPFISKGDAERYLGDVMHALYDMRPTTRMLVVLGEPLEGGSHIDRVPPNATVIDLGNDWPQLTMEHRHLIALKLIQSVAPRARLHLRQASFPERFYGSFKNILRSNPTVFYCLGDIMEVDPAGAFVRPWGFNFVSEHVQDLALIIADNQTIIECDQGRIAVCTEKWRWLPARHSPSLTEAEAVARAATRKGRVLWASRLDRSEQLELLPQLAKKLTRLASDIQIDVFGSTVLDTSRLGSLAGLPNLAYRGAFDGFASLDHSAYDAFVYTTAFDGVPSAILEAIAAGKPVIAPDVGGIGEIIIDGDTGLLLPALTNDEEMVAAYAAAIVRLADDPALRAKLVAGALRRLVDRHGLVAFAEAARAIFGRREAEATKHRSYSPQARSGPSMKTGMVNPLPSRESCNNIKQRTNAVYAERQHFHPGQKDYHAVLAAEHISRHAFAASLCVGKRVLDVACGDGYGAFLLAQQGARVVVGVDVAEEAIAIGRHCFARDGVEFLLGNLLDLPGVLGKRAPFDVIVSFETIEHVSDPGRFLDGVRRVLAPGGIVLVSCSSDAREAAWGSTNRLHTKRYTLADFQKMTTGVLGAAALWYLGAPLQGIIIDETPFRPPRDDNDDLSRPVDGRDASYAHLLPVQSHLRLTPEISTFYLGIWGTTGNAANLPASMSKRIYIEPWWALEWFKERVAFLEEQNRELWQTSMTEKARLGLESLKERVAFLEEQIAELRRASMVQKARLFPQQAHQAIMRLREIESSRGHRLLQRYYMLAGAPVIGPVIQLLRRIARRVPHLVRRLRAAW